MNARLDLIACPICKGVNPDCFVCLGRGCVPVLAGEDCFVCGLPCDDCVCPLLGVPAESSSAAGPLFASAGGEEEDIESPASYDLI